MKAKPSVVVTLIIGVALALTWAVNAQGAEPLTVNINLGPGDPPTLDPALASDSSSVAVIEQLFIGLVDLDDDTAQVQPELATSWTVSPDGTVYTFTLRNDVYWTDGHPVTAGDVRYGILRTLDPATQADYAYPLFVIKNAEGYNSGTITDPNQVGVTALDNTHLRITLEHPASYVLSILSLWVARPMPQWAIEAHGVPTWTMPVNIVTNGAYRLTEWVHDDHILLDKNPTYYDAANVQIERVRMWMVDQGTAWTMYLNGQLDAAAIPAGHAHEVLPQEVHIGPVACTYYYGFSVSQPPFNRRLVRQAFAAATDREGLVAMLGGGQRPALTFTPPGVFGHVDGYAEGVGIPYDPIQARQWLAQAGYPNGQGLPPITLWFNTSAGHQAIAEYLRNSWYTTLGVSVTLQSMSWGDYLSQLPNGQFQIWRLGWCMDYPDANDFLSDAVIPHRAYYGGWTNATYNSLLNQAAREQNPDTRRALYRQAEEILVETDAVMIPLYHYSYILAVKPYLERTYPASMEDISTWRITRASGHVGTGGGSLTSYHGDTILDFPAGAITDTVVITHTPAYGLPPGGDLADIGHTFDITAVYSDTGELAQLAPGQTYTLTVHYTDAERGPVVEETLSLWWWDGDEWIEEPTSVVDPVANTVTATPDHFSLWAVLGETRRVYLPTVMRKR